MKEKDYLELCMICNRLLALPESTLEMVAIPWLHVIREHPIFLIRYEKIFSEISDYEKICNTIKLRIYNYMVWLRQLYRALAHDGKGWFGKDSLPKRIDILFISHLLNPSQYSDEKDFYFDKIPAELNNNGRGVLVAKISQFSKPFNSFNPNLITNQVPQIFFSNSLSLSKELEIKKRLKLEARRIKKLKGKDVLQNAILDEAALQALSGSAQGTMRLYEQIRELVITLKPKAIIIPYEGHAYERIGFAAAREASSDIKCLSYQHSVIFRLSNAVRVLLKPQYNPEIILTSGVEAKEELERSFSNKEILIKVLGSPKGIDESLSLENYALDKSDKTCLVIPEGILSECLLILSFSLQCARENPSVKFIWRLHPSVSFKDIKRSLRNVGKFPSNIVLSNETLEHDIAKSSYALYRGSSAIFQAISFGLRPVYLEIPDEMTIDPIYKMDEWKIKVSEVSDFTEVLKVDHNVDQVNLGREICNSYFGKIDSAKLEEVIFSEEV